MGASAPRGSERPGREHLHVVRAVSGLAFFRRGGWRIGFFVACERFTDISDGFLRTEVDRAGGRTDGYFFRGVPKGGYGLECFFQVAETGRPRRVYRFLVPAEEPEGKQVGAESTRGYSGGGCSGQTPYCPAGGVEERSYRFVVCGLCEVCAVGDDTHRRGGYRHGTALLGRGNGERGVCFFVERLTHRGGKGTEHRIDGTCGRGTALFGFRDHVAQLQGEETCGTAVFPDIMYNERKTGYHEKETGKNKYVDEVFAGFCRRGASCTYLGGEQRTDDERAGVENGTATGGGLPGVEPYGKLGLLYGDVAERLFCAG